MWSDIPKTHWAYQEIALARLLHIAQGYPDGTFKPDQPATRAEATTFALRACGVALLLGAGMAGIAYYAATKRAGRK
jgi:S-layer homology domain.